ncbi:MAG: hypothetical protein JO290_11750 [Sphingomonadaceae bacterium]|nr:hypothetical protein [Sphingomonadaceae bacterium]
MADRALGTVMAGLALLTAPAHAASPSPAPAAPPPGTPFTAICADVLNVQSGDRLLFTCLPPGGAPLTVAVAFSRDVTGVMPAPADAARIAEADHSRQAQIAGLLTTFVLIKAVNPASAATLALSGTYSRLPASAGVACVSVATLRR